MKNNTTAVKKEEIKRAWHLLDAEGKILGKLAEQAARILIGKNKAIFSPNQNTGDKLVITNAAKIVVTGKKMTDKLYQWHTGFPGGLREETLASRMEKNPAKVLRLAIQGMLPKNRLQRARMANLYISADATHPHTAHFKTKA